MATLQIDPVPAHSKGGYPVTITGLCPTDADCLVGAIVTPAGLTQAQWNLSGIMRGGSAASSCDLDMQVADLAELSRLAQQLGAKP